MTKTDHNITWAGVIDPLTAGIVKGEDVAANAEMDDGMYTFARLGEAGLYSIVVANENENDQMYVVAFTKKGIGCSCDTFKDGGKRCRHIIAVGKLGSGKESLARDNISETMMLNAVDDVEKWTFDADQNMVPPQPGNFEAPETQASDVVDSADAGIVVPEAPEEIKEPEQVSAKDAHTEEPPVIEAEIVPPPTSKKHTCKICGKEHDTIDAVLNCIEGHKDNNTDIVTTPPTQSESADYVPSVLQQLRPIAPMIRGLNLNMREAGGVRIGKKGDVYASGKGRSTVTYDHFIFTTPDKDDNEDFIIDQTMTNLMGDECTEIPIRLLSDDPTESFRTFYAKYGGRGMIWWGDGVDWIVMKPDGTREFVHDPDGTHGFLKDKDTKMQGILTFIIEGQNSVGSVWKYRTSGRNSIEGTMASLFMNKRIAENSGGRIAFLPMKLVYSSRWVTPKGQSRKKKIPIVTVEYRGSIEDLQQKSREATDYSAPQRQIAHNVDGETLEQQIDVHDEFYPGVE
jgi:hypothetical protein